jgi:hypothetical protein
MGTLLTVDRMRGNAKSMRVLYGWLEVQIPARLADATQSGIHWCKHRADGKVAVFSILYAINLKKKRFYSTKQETYYRVLAENLGRPR